MLPLIQQMHGDVAGGELEPGRARGRTSSRSRSRCRCAAASSAACCRSREATRGAAATATCGAPLETTSGHPQERDRAARHRARRSTCPTRPAAGRLRPERPRAGAAQPAHQRPRGDARTADGSCVERPALRRRRCDIAIADTGCGHRRRAPAAGARAVLHHQGRRQRPRPVHLPLDPVGGRTARSTHRQRPRRRHPRARRACPRRRDAAGAQPHEDGRASWSSTTSRACCAPSSACSAATTTWSAAARRREALALAAEFKPDLAILDIRMPELDGFELMARLKARSPRPRRHPDDRQRGRSGREADPGDPRRRVLLHPEAVRPRGPANAGRALPRAAAGGATENRRHVERLETEIGGRARVSAGAAARPSTWS